MAETISLPKLGFDMTEGTFLNWVKHVGDPVKTGDVIAEVEADKATIEVESTASGVLLQTLVNTGQVVPVGAPIAMIGEANEKAAAPAAATAAPAPATEKKAEKKSAPVTNGAAVAPAETVTHTNGDEFPGGVKASPVARKIAQAKGIDLHLVHGTGPGGRIQKSDVESFVAPAAHPATGLTSYPATVPSGPGIIVEAITKLRQRIASRMIQSKLTTPHFYVTTEIDMKAALEMRKLVINASLPDGNKVTVNDMVVKAVALVLRDFPNLNSHYYGDKIVRYKNINIGMAVALEGGGLINVVAKDADKLSISQIAQRNRELIAAARAGKVRPEDIEGSTFTVSNLGAYDVEHFAAIINPPEAAILAVGTAKDVPVVINGEIKVGSRMKCTLSVDHRVSDGAEGARFMQAFKNMLENPMRLLL